MREYTTIDRQKAERNINGTATVLRREERINMARSAFGRNPAVRSSQWRGNGDIAEGDGSSGQSGSLIRLVAAGLLFVLFVGLCYFDVSVQGYDRQWLESCLQDNRLWEQMTGAVADCINRLR